jgi:hypothetical protein
MSRTVSDPLAAARDAFRTHDWMHALDLFKQSDARDGLTPEDLESMAEAAWWAARPEEAISGRLPATAPTGVDSAQS